MKIQEILRNDENKILFLKAILLGINYGKSKESDSYIEIIEKEINQIKNFSQSNDINNKNNIKNIDIVVKNITKNIIELENLRNNIMVNINNLSTNNYNNNYLKINSLRNTLTKINNNIDQNRLNLLNFVDDKNLANSRIKNIKKKILEKNRVKKKFIGVSN